MGQQKLQRYEEKQTMFMSPTGAPIIAMKILNDKNWQTLSTEVEEIEMEPEEESEPEEEEEPEDEPTEATPPEDTSAPDPAPPEDESPGEPKLLAPAPWLTARLLTPRRSRRC